MQIRFFAGAAEAAGHDTLTVDADALSLEQLRAHLSADNPHLARVLEVCSWLADGRRIEGGSLAGVAQLDVLPPFAGG